MASNSPERYAVRKKADSTEESPLIGIILSVSAEGGMLLNGLRRKTDAGPQVFYGRLDSRRIVVIVSGMGKVNAAHAATRLIVRQRPSLIMNVGIGGAYPASGLNVGDIAVAEKEIYGDEGVALKDGFHGNDLIGIPLVTKGRRKWFNEFDLDKNLANKAVTAAQRVAYHASPVTVKKGTFLTLSTCSGTKKRATELHRRFGAICENMEGAAIAHICTLHDIPFVEIRGISNIVEDRDRSKWHTGLAAENCQLAAREFVKGI